MTLRLETFCRENLYKLTITGKGNKTRRIVIAKPSGILLKRYLEETGRARQLETYIFSSQTHPQMTISCVEEIYKNISPLQEQDIPECFWKTLYPAYHETYNRHTYVRSRSSDRGD